MGKELFISIVILNYNGKGFLEECLSSVLRSDYANFEVIVVDNASEDTSIQNIERKYGTDSRLKIIRNAKNLLFAGGNNTGIKAAQGEFVVVLNNDTEVERNWLREITFLMQDENIGAAQPKVLAFGSEPTRIDYAGVGLDRFGFAKAIGAQEIDRGQYDRLEQIFYAAGTAMVLRKSVLEEVGLFDEKFGMHWEDADLCWRIHLAGYKIVAIPRAIVYHKGSLTMRKFTSRSRVSFFVRRNRLAGLIKNYNLKNLTIYLPGLVILYILFFIKELVLDRDLAMAFSNIRAVLWNLWHLPYLLRKRAKIGAKIRKVSDAKILALMEKKSVVFAHFCGNL